MAALTEESLNKLNKPDLIALVVSLQRKMDSVNSDLVAELRKMREGFDQMKSDLSITKKVNTLLSERLQTIEKQCWANAQYSRRECLEISGIPSSVNDNDLEDVVCKAITKAGVEVSDKDIEDCHRVGKRGTTIVKFCKRKVSKQVLNVRKDLTKLSMEDLQLTGQGKLYINQSLCPYCRVLWSKSKSLHRMGKIFSYYVSNGTVKIKIQETSKPLSIMHTSDLEKLFPDVDLSPTV